MLMCEKIEDIGRRLGLTQEEMLCEMGKRLICVAHPKTKEEVWCWVIGGTGKRRREKVEEVQAMGTREARKEERKQRRGFWGSLGGWLSDLNKAIDRNIEADLRYGGGDGFFDHVNGMGQADVDFMLGRWGK